MMFRNLTNKSIICVSQYRRLSTNVMHEKVKNQTKMKAWQVHGYGDLSELQECNVRIPHIQDPNEVLINVEAASVNPIDILMMGGYGRTLIQIPRKWEMELPLTLGRDFCGTIIHKGHKVASNFKIGDRVYGFKPLHQEGTFAEVIVANADHIQAQPEHLSPSESASLVYAAMTAWSALYLFGALSCKPQVCGTKVLILGASGGVGTVAVQLLKSQGCEVVGTCSTNAMPLVKSLNADCVLDYTDPNYLQNVENGGYYHTILDCAKFGFDKVPKTWNFDQYITLNSPLLVNTDKHGLVGGLLASANSLFQANLKSPGKGKQLKWAFFTPSSTGFQFINKLISERKINPLIHKEFNFEQLPDAFKEVMQGHLRGKVVVKNYK